MAVEDAVLAPSGRARIAALAVVLFALVFVARLFFGAPGDGLTFLYLLPICLLAMEWGPRAGLGAALAGVLLVAAWDVLDANELSALGYGIRVAVFAGVAVLCGAMADRVRRAGEQSDRYFELSSQMLGIFTPDGRPIRLNCRWTETLGWTIEQLMTADVADLVHPDDLPLAQDMLEHIVAGREEGEVRFSLRMLAVTGEIRHVDWTSTRDRREGVIYTAAQDVTERHTLESDRRQAEARFRVAFEDSATGMAVVSLTAEHSGQIVEANQELSRILGVSQEKLLGLSGILDFAHPGDAPRLREEMAGLAEGDHQVVRRELRIVRPDGSARWVHLTSSLLYGEDGEPRFRLSQLMDIDARKRADEQVRHMADHDPLSWLFNRRRFVDELRREVEARPTSDNRGAVLLIDLDNFKQVNDRSGHRMGDEVIKTVALALVRRLRSGDVAGRLGGDEFGVMLRRVSGEEAVLVSHDLLEAVSEALAGLEDEVASGVTLSIGIALIEGAPSSADQLLERADDAMYEAKRDGGARVALSASVFARA